MTSDHTWRIGDVYSWPNRLYDSFRMRLNRKLVRFLFTAIGRPSLNRTLEAGSGSASGSFYFSSQHGVKQSVALDHDLEALQITRSRYPQVQVVVGDLQQLPFKDSVFDLVWNNSTMEHLDQANTALNEMKRTAQHDGFTFVGVPDKHGPFWFQPLIQNTDAGRWIGPVFTGRELRQWFQEVHMDIVKVHHFFLRLFVGVLAKKK